MTQHAHDWRPERGTRPSEAGDPPVRPHTCTGAPLGYFVDRIHGDERTGRVTFGVFRSQYDEDCFFDPVLVRGGFTSEPEAEAEAARLTGLNGLVIELLLTMPAKMTNAALAIYHRGRAKRICETLERLEQEDEHRRRCERLARHARQLLLALARKQRLHTDLDAEMAATLAESKAMVEGRKIEQTLAKHKGNVSRAARELGISRGGLHKKLRQMKEAAK